MQHRDGRGRPVFQAFQKQPASRRHSRGLAAPRLVPVGASDPKKGEQFHDRPPSAKFKHRSHVVSGQDTRRPQGEARCSFAYAGAELRCPDGLCEKRLSACPQQGNAELSSDESDVKEISGKFSRRNWRVQILLMRAKKSLGVAGKG